MIHSFFVWNGLGYTFSMDSHNLPAWWAHRQGLADGAKSTTAAKILESVGWSRSVGGVGPYLTLFSRGRHGRQSIDKAVSDCEIHELPAARGCTYVVPACDFALALTCAQGTGEEQEMKVARKLGVTDSEIDKLSSAILTALKNGPLDPEGIRQATGDASRSLGPEGQMKGMTTTLPLAISKLQVLGCIRRLSVNGRLDQQRYQYTLWSPNPLEKSKWTKEEAHVELARRYFRWIGPATLPEFQWFSGLGVKAANAAVEPLQLAAYDEDKWMHPQDLDSLRSFKPSKDHEYHLTSSMDSMVLLRRNHTSLLASQDLNRSILGDKGIAALSSVSDLPSHAIFTNHGRLVGLWEYDKDTQNIAYCSFEPKNAALVKAVEETEGFIKDQVGDARSFSLDSPKSRIPRIQALREMA